MNSSRKTILLLIIFLVFSLLNFSLLIRAEEKNQRSYSRQIPLVIFYTSNLIGVMDKNDLPGGTGGGLDRIATIMALLKRVHPYYLLLDSGGNLSGTLLVDNFKGKPAVEVMNFMKYDASVPGVYDFIRGASVLKERIREAKYPFLAANVKDSAGRQWDGAVPYIIKEVGIMKVAVLGLATPDTSKKHFRNKLEGIYFNDPVETARFYVPLLRANCDLLIVLSHLGLKEEKKLARKVDGIDLIIGGYSTEALSYPVRIGSTLVLHAGAGAEFLGTIEIVFEESSQGGLHIVKINGMQVYPGPGSFNREKYYLGISPSLKTPYPYYEVYDFSYKEQFLIPVQGSVIPDENVVKILKPYRKRI